jgi:type I restriction enzyme, S subunit
LPLGRLTKIFDGTRSTPNYVEEGVPFYSVEHLTANDFSRTKYISEDIFEKENKRERLVQGDILMTRIGDIGTAKHLNWDVRASFYVSLALVKSSPSFDSEYMTQYINSKIFRSELWKRTIHVAFPKKINLGEISNCLVAIPKLQEQQKIATVLYSPIRKSLP